MEFVQRVTQRIWRDIWTLGILETAQDARTFLRKPPRWFFIALVACGIFGDMFFACAMSGVVAEQARWLRSLMP